MPVAEVAGVRRGTAISAVYGTVRIEPAFVVRVRAQNDGFIRLAEPFLRVAARSERASKKANCWRRSRTNTSRQLKQARADLQAASAEPRSRCPLRRVAQSGRGQSATARKGRRFRQRPAVEYQRAKAEANRLRGRSRDGAHRARSKSESLEETVKKLEAQMKKLRIRSPMDGILTNVQTIDGELVLDGNELFTVSSRRITSAAK